MSTPSERKQSTHTIKTLLGPDREDLVLTTAETRMLLLILHVSHFHGSEFTFRDLLNLTGTRQVRGVVVLLNKLRRKGMVAWDRNKWRTIRPLVRIEIFPGEMFGMPGAGDPEDPEVANPQQTE